MADALDICAALHEAVVVRQATAIAEQAPGAEARYGLPGAALPNDGQLRPTGIELREYHEAAGRLEDEAARLRLEWQAIDELESELPPD